MTNDTVQTRQIDWKSVVDETEGKERYEETTEYEFRDREFKRKPEDSSLYD